ncbi:hypothetical protein SAMN05216481_108130 [Streptomyces radiopugnans]|uniref:SCO6045-like C-terminal domain-containing protein n=1 Tax=Streptomyces radiopugnans TaxID=403935 RepID=A0A1H9G7C8_9ACTN|nr:hypothetical protein SAMN05216481_108130 [Streptomyces radiopugnans]
MSDTGPGSRPVTAPGLGPGPVTDPGSGTDAARRRLATVQAALLGALVADGPVPAGFDPERLEIQRRALVAKRASVIAGIAPELPDVLGDQYRPAFAAYARGRPMTGGYRPDAMRFVAHLLDSDPALSRRRRRRLRRWYRERSGQAPRGWGLAGLLPRRLRRTRPGA